MEDDPIRTRLQQRMSARNRVPQTRSGESLEEVHAGLHPDIQNWLASRPPESSRAVLENMRSMMPAERHGYGMSLARP